MDQFHPWTLTISLFHDVSHTTQHLKLNYDHCWFKTAQGGHFVADKELRPALKRHLSIKCGAIKKPTCRYIAAIMDWNNPDIINLNSKMQ